MYLKRIIEIFPPRLTSRITAGVLAFVLTLAVFKSVQLIINGKGSSENVTPPISDGGNDNIQVDAGINTDTQITSPIINTNSMLSITHGIYAESSVLYNIEKNEITCEKNMKYEVGCGDITVFAAAILIADKIEKGIVSEGEYAVCPASAAKRPNYALSSEIYSVGERLDVLTLLKCMLYQRGSSFAYSLAVHISGSEEEFTSEINAILKDIGAEATLITGVCGNDDGIAKTTAYDMAVILKKFFSYELLKDIFESDEPVIIRKKGINSSVYLTVTNDFFEFNCTGNQAELDGIVGGKSGYCGYLGWCIVMFRDSSYSYISITLLSPSAFSDAMHIYTRRELPEG